MQVLVLAGGLGTRLRPRTETLPKALVPVAGRPFAERQVELLASHGVDDIVFAIAYLGPMVRDVLGDGRRWGVRIRYVDEGDQRRGTGGATRLFTDSGLADDDFAILYGDSYLPIDYHAVWDAHARCGLPALMTVIRNDDRWDSSNASLDGEGRVHYHKGAGKDEGLTYIDYGLTVVSASLVSERIPRSTVSDLAELFTDLGEVGMLAGFEVFERFYEVGSEAGIADLEDELARRTGASPP
ncbi:MAG TPA: sugar phosphate nucleotidyltransferase [Acidimicrobiales bacterium]|nr:sugar phosphate nucleotidyltransferase [Acidimicrobiales bacterium]